MFFQYDFKPYIAIIGDIVASKKLKDRSEIQKKLNGVLSEINDSYADRISARFMITLGDEFQGLLADGESVIDIIQRIQIRMYPVKLRIGIGIGKIETEINHLIPYGADGSAYHHARRMIEQLKNTENKNKSYDADIMIAADGGNSDLVILLNTILSLCTAIRQRWTERQREVAYDCFLNGDNQTAAAQRLKISQPAVQKLLSKADYYTYKKSMDVVSQSLQKIKADSHV
ncbi:hypothetical protein FRZ06_07720 [Anoxybacterium hadale]|uniref:Uncharacterized protein n=1 Tax=Anoxybacterium hadale TaxID=3408580 RepID=A0ACD1AA96_9FIRM|nr:hypothetical protein FRZ06_07720 [Clostridiales bacterium]